jgi:hypothetical protein
LSSQDRTPAHVRKRRRARWLKLQEQGYKDYADYLRSSHWARKKAEYRASELPQACMCGEENVQLHHKTYERIGAELLTDLEPLCGRCHAAVHSLEYRGEMTLDTVGLQSSERAAVYAVEQEPLLERAEAQSRLAARKQWYAEMYRGNAIAVVNTVREIADARGLTVAELNRRAGVHLKGLKRDLDRILTRKWSAEYPNVPHPFPVEAGIVGAAPWQAKT